MAQTPSGTGSIIGGATLLLCSSGCATWVFVLGLLGIIFTAVFPFAFGTPFDDLRLDRAELALADGEIEDLSLVPNTSINEQAVYTLRYRFDADGQPIVDEARVLEYDALSQASPGQALEVEYLPEDPTLSRPAGAKSNPGGWAGIIGLPMLGLALLGLLPLALILGLGVWLVRKGLMARAAGGVS
jgi:hypothetical protein